jgi:hypothetical protein
LRPSAATAIVVVMLSLCALTVSTAGGKVMIGMVVLAHLIGLPVWVGVTCSKSITRERALETFDFWRTTRLTSHDLIIGQLCGVPLMGIWAVVCTIPVAVMAVALEISPFDLMLAYGILLLFSATIGLAGLVMSMWAAPVRNGRGLVWFLGGYVLVWIFWLGGGESLWGANLGAMTPYHYLDSLGGSFGKVSVNIMAPQTVVFFGAMHVPSLLVGVALNLSFSGWLYLMLHRNIKKNLEEIRLLSRWQSVGLVLFLNGLLLAFWQPGSGDEIEGISRFEQGIYSLNLMTLYIVGVIMLTPQERLRVWWQEWSVGRASYLDEDGLPWPWIMVTAVCTMGVAYLGVQFSHEDVISNGLMLPLGVIAAFVMRDVLFLQWCVGREFKRPIFTGLLYLGLYYFIAGVLSEYFPVMRYLLLPSVIVQAEQAYMIATLTMQIIAAMIVLYLLTQQLKQPARSLAPAHGRSGGPPASPSQG